VWRRVSRACALSATAWVRQLDKPAARVDQERDDPARAEENLLLTLPPWAARLGRFACRPRATWLSGGWGFASPIRAVTV
jgi:hypothetical protein